MISCYHGLIGSAENWRQLSSFLYKSDTLIHQELDYLRNQMCALIEIERAQFAKVTDQNKIVVGNSLGCILALGVASEVDRIVLTAPPYLSHSGVLPRKKAGINQYIQQMYFERNLSKTEVQELETVATRVASLLADRGNFPALRRVRNELMSINYWNIVRTHKEKVHIVLGDEDQLTPKDAILKFIKEQVPEVNVSILRNCGHAVPLEKPKELAKIVERYT